MADHSLLIILGNQLFPIEEIKRTKIKKVFMKEDLGLCTNYRHHKLKIFFFLSSMRQYRDYLMENGYVQNLDFFDLDLYSQDKESLYSMDEELELDKYEVRKDSLNIYEDDSKFGGNSTVAAETSNSIDESAVSSDWTKFATEDDDSE